MKTSSLSRRLGSALSLLLVTCMTNPRLAHSASAEADYFGSRRGCFLLYDMKSDRFDSVIGEPTCRERLPAASTFKVPLAVMAFDSGVLRDETEVLKWDGVKDVREVANRDHDARSWMKESIVWFSQRLTPRIGKERFQKYLDDFSYGNRDLSGGITEAWLVRPGTDAPALKISAYEQVEFMKKLWRDELPATPRAMRIARELTRLETSPHGFELSGKSGSNFYDDERKRRFGWFIGHLAKDGREYIIATNISETEPTEASETYGGPIAKAITKTILTDRNLW